MNSRLKEGLVDRKELIYETKQRDKRNANMKKDFIEEYDKLINVLIKSLKENSEWSQLGDYYLALRYILNIIDNGYFKEFNQSVGIQMMQSFALLDNNYALNFFRVCDEK